MPWIVEPDPVGGSGRLRPVEQTSDALVILRQTDGEDLEGQLQDVASRVVRLCPDCVALSLTLWGSGLTFTLVRDDRAETLSDAVLYVDDTDDDPDGAALLAADHAATRVDLAADSLREDRWLHVAESGARLGIGSTLSLPVLQDDEVVASIDLYGATADAFDGRHDLLAEVCGAWPGSAVSNADLAFTSRIRAAAAPDRLIDQGDLDLAVGILATRHGVGPEQAARRVVTAASRAGVSAAELAKFVVDTHQADVDDQG